MTVLARPGLAVMTMILSAKVTASSTLWVMNTTVFLSTSQMRSSSCCRMVPFSALDEQNRTILQQELLRIWEVDKKTVVFITHSVDEAVTLADKIMVMTASPGRAKTVINVSLERPRNVLELRNDPRYGRIVYGIWGHLKDEVERARLDAAMPPG